jgi:hypothetical protein
MPTPCQRAAGRNRNRVFARISSSQAALIDHPDLGLILNPHILTSP